MAQLTQHVTMWPGDGGAELNGSGPQWAARSPPLDAIIAIADERGNNMSSLLHARQGKCSPWSPAAARNNSKGEAQARFWHDARSGVSSVAFPRPPLPAAEPWGKLENPVRKQRHGKDIGWTSHLRNKEGGGCWILMAGQAQVAADDCAAHDCLAYLP
ncbi:hypothetical protein K461DRAFT_80051 [Myriangium duriaei CBS 260.36]|uniref:Uncharacterized protein n=1 Tax=Myriangium duriaei CBS 260.36 TaxID=1168546 RepID=A0A9P4J5C6_9PEZI|nr:hypothetical protein K461DRAFT_80051 [Myriangium duriaei CBS 260.36]